MRTRGDIKTKLQPMLLAVGTSSFFTETRINSAIDDAYITVASSRPWDEVKRGFVTGTLANQQYYDYPDNCKTESVFRIAVDNDPKYRKMDFESFLDYLEENPNSSEKIFSEYGRQVFLNPTPTSNGTANLVLWGVMQASSLTSDSDVTIFTDWADNLNEAVLQQAYADLIQSLDPNKATQAETKSEKIIAKEFTQIAQRKQRKLKGTPMFAVPDYFATGGVSEIGNFGIRNED